MTRFPLILLAAATACRTGPPQPAAIEEADICSFCKMTISETRYAAQFVDREEAARKFDDIGCMIRYVKERSLRESVAAFFVSDYESREWLPAERARYVRSEALPSPMASGLVAVQDEVKADELARRHNGRLLAFDDLWKE